MKRILASRRLSSSTGTSISVSLGVPVRVRRGEWKVSISIRGLNQPIREDVFGYDAIQAIILAFATIRNALAESGLEITWRGGEVGDTGFPYYVSNVHGVAFARKLEKQVQSALDMETAKLERGYRKKELKRTKAD